jgi:hypothetical protein
MGMQKDDKPDDWIKVRNQWLWDDFFSYLDVYTWTKLLTGTGSTVALAPGPATQLALSTGTVAGGEAAVWTTNKFWQFQANQPNHCVARINAQEANVNNLSIYVGFTSVNTTGLVTATNPNAINSNFSGAGFFLPAGSTNWSVVTSIGTAQLITPTIEPAVVSTDQYMVVQADVVGTGLEVTFHVGNAEVRGGADSVAPVGWQQAREGLSGYNKPIKHRLPYAGAAQMVGGVYARGISATAESVRVDFIGLLSLR